ncbi:putative isoamyl acetate-hydrolyzing esterase [Clavispora lusitaniae]|uniref:Isoamyl acetate-hydrolyzing esterase n=1 Tax=Clavispora lusitaniae TaxID=36911 RepID=A0ACD0WQ68_CLALS|nr:putative isoamyl acetate-hydrolyzing esterase [Clavispora lusitaniae]QFZ35604.1 putative isoamyl acetate-hydrolyzing esterase [Clavispora lusitaniae]QFZ52186.1 putative isoamyl acetate-hydrolyzing esterase [Clavispora lusitaniae]
MPYKIDRFILFGDSITEYSSNQDGFAMAPALQDLYSTKLDIVTRGFSGYNTNQGVVMLEQVLEAEKLAGNTVRLMYVFMGTNDAATTFQHVSLDQYKQNLDKMVKMILKEDIKVMVVGPTLHEENASPEFKDEPPFSSSKRNKQYADVAKEVATENNVPFVDLWSAFQKESGYTAEELLEKSRDLKKFLRDGVHFTPAGYKILYNELVKTINTSLPELAPENLRSAFPYYRDVDFDNSRQSLLDYLKKSS